jgi:hypothetical protein
MSLMQVWALPAGVQQREAQSALSDDCHDHQHARIPVKVQDKTH